MFAPPDLAACRALLRSGSRSFRAASLLLPPRVRDAATALYAFCRVADDAVDGSADPAAALELLRQRLADAACGQPADSPVDRAFAVILERYGIPVQVPEAMLEGFAWDANGRQYDSLSQLNEYAVRVAGTVGVMMTLLMERREPEVLASACDLGVAMQLTNIARDVGEDARLGRLYLPRDWLREAGIDPEAWRLQPQFSPQLAEVIARLLAAAEPLYARAGSAIAHLPGACRPGVHAARLIYARIGAAVQARRHDSVNQRAIVSGWEKSALLGAAIAAACRPAGAIEPAVVEEGRFLVEAVPLPAAMPMTGGRVVWLIELFERLEREQARRAVAGEP
jgi:phytoene synthase